MTTYNSFHDYLLHRYQNGGGFAHESMMLFGSSRRMLEQAKIVRNIDNAITINKVVESFSKKGMPRGHRDQDYFNLVKILTSYYEYLTDDIMLISAYELYAKGTLLKKQYIPHQCVEETEQRFSKDQKKAPYHVRTYRAQIKKGKKIYISEKTLPVSIILKDKYSRVIGTPPSIVKELSRINQVRTRLHFTEPAMYKIESKFLQTVLYLCSTIPQSSTINS